MKTATILLIASLIIFPIIGLTQASTLTDSCNNDGICDKYTGETTTNCEKDCYESTTIRWGTCGDKICQTTESKSSCSVDCGYPWVCGDGICGGTETDWNCPQDCPKPEIPSVYCGDNICQSDESCPIDCGYPLVCGDAICSENETPDNCPKDCLHPIKPITIPAPTTSGGDTGGGGGVISTTPTPITSETPISKPTIIGTPGPTTATTILPATQCGLNNYKVCNECGLGVYKNVFVQCSDGSEVTLGVASSCKPTDLWKQYATEACRNHCSSGGWGGWSDLTSGPIVCVEGGNEGGNITTPLPPTTIRPVEIPKATPVCYISDDLMQKYSQLIIELQKSESDKTRAEEITKQIIELKQQIAAQQNECVRNSPQPTPKIVPWPAPTSALRPTPTPQSIAIENIPVAVSIDRCNEVAQWANKIAYYKKLSNLSDDDLKKNGFSREEIENIMRELSSGVEKVRAQCGYQEKTSSVPGIAAITGSASITETVKPVVAESGQEISVYYKSRIEKAVSINGEEKQIEELKTLRDEIDGLISNLIKSRKELEVSELNTLVKEVKISRGEIKADDISVKTTEKKILVSIGDRPVSVEPTENRVLILDKGLEVNASEVMIKENVLSVGGVDVKMSASEVTEKLNIAPKTIELKEENTKAVYNMKIEERRKLFGLIPFNSQKTITADADNGNTLSEQLPWYNFLTTK